MGLFDIFRGKKTQEVEIEDTGKIEDLANRVLGDIPLTNGEFIDKTYSKFIKEDGSFFFKEADEENDGVNEAYRGTFGISRIGNYHKDAENNNETDLETYTFISEDSYSMGEEGLEREGLKKHILIENPKGSSHVQIEYSYDENGKYGPERVTYEMPDGKKGEFTKEQAVALMENLLEMEVSKSDDIHYAPWRVNSVLNAKTLELAIERKEKGENLSIDNINEIKAELLKNPMVQQELILARKEETKKQVQYKVAKGAVFVGRLASVASMVAAQGMMISKTIDMAKAQAQEQTQTNSVNSVETPEVEQEVSAQPQVQTEVEQEAPSQPQRVSVNISGMNYEKTEDGGYDYTAVVNGEQVTGHLEAEDVGKVPEGRSPNVTQQWLRANINSAIAKDVSENMTSSAENGVTGAEMTSQPQVQTEVEQEAPKSVENSSVDLEARTQENIQAYGYGLNKERDNKEEIKKALNPTFEDKKEEKTVEIVEEKPAEEKTAEEKPAKEKPVEEKTVEEKPAEKPAEKPLMAADAVAKGQVTGKKNDTLNPQNLLDVYLQTKDKIAGMGDAIDNAFQVMQSPSDKSIVAIINKKGSYIRDDEDVLSYFATKNSSISFDDALKMVLVQKEKGMDSLTVTGNEEFKEQVFLAASCVGLPLENYKPSEKTLQKLEEKMRDEKLMSALHGQKKEVLGTITGKKKEEKPEEKTVEIVEEKPAEEKTAEEKPVEEKQTEQSNKETKVQSFVNSPAALKLRQSYLRKTGKDFSSPIRDIRGIYANKNKNTK
jgi:outer membrane biosynthesis protein TonB